MELEVYVGPLVRFYLDDWENAERRAAREAGRPPAPPPEDAITDPAEVAEIVELWRQDLAKALGRHASVALDWAEEPMGPYATGQPTWAAYVDLLLWAAYEEHPELPRPASSVADLANDPAYKLSSSQGSGTRYPHLLGCQWWLPVDIPFTFMAHDPAGKRMAFGSSPRLLSELSWLNSATWQADEPTLAAWRAAGRADATLESGARFALALLADLGRTAVARRHVMKLDY